MQSYGERITLPITGVDSASPAAPATAHLSRRTALKWLGLLAAGAMAGCTPLRLGLRLYPTDFARDRTRTERVLRAFVATIVPGAPLDAPHLVRIYFDDFYPFTPHTAFFASDLCGRAARLHGAGEFEALPATARTEVVRSGLAADRITRKLYSGAILLAQISFYGSIYDDEEGCALIDFPGRSWGNPAAALTHQEPLRYLAVALTADGNLS